MLISIKDKVTDVQEAAQAALYPYFCGTLSHMYLFFLIAFSIQYVTRSTLMVQLLEVNGLINLAHLKDELPVKRLWELR